MSACFLVRRNRPSALMSVWIAARSTSAALLESTSFSALRASGTTRCRTMRTPMLWKSSSLKLVRSGGSSGCAWHLLQRARSLKSPPPLGRLVDRLLVARDEAVEGRIERGQRPFVRRDRRDQVLAVRRPAEHFLKGLLILGIGRERRDGCREVRLRHLHGIHDRERRLILESLRSTVPELRLVVERVQHGRR